MKAIISCILFLFSFLSFSQVVDNFSDGNFTFNPNWIGTDTKFQINSSYQLRTNGSTADTAYLLVDHKLTNLSDKEWRCWIKHSFSPSSNNFSRFYLTSNSLDLKTNPDGYYLLFGEAGSSDAVRLFRSENGISKELANATIGAIATNFIVSVKVVRDDKKNWLLYIDYNGGSNYQLEAAVNDTLKEQLGTYTGVYCQYTKTNASKFYFDNFYIGEREIDTIKPTVKQVDFISSNTCKVTFSEDVDTVHLSNIDLIYLDTSQSLVFDSCLRDSLHKNCIYFFSNATFINNHVYSFQLRNIQDLVGNTMSTTLVGFTYLQSEEPSYNDLIINEIMANPSPSIGLPEIEYIEVYNKSERYFNVKDWIVTDGNAIGRISNTWIKPGEYKILCATSAVPFFSGSIGVSNFPSLNNAGDVISLKDSIGNLMDEVAYSENWSSVSSGGFSLERINPFHPCSDSSNWSSSVSEEGGTPGEVNSIFDSIFKENNIQVVATEVISPTILKVYFNQQMDTSNWDWKKNIAMDMEVVSWKANTYNFEIETKDSFMFSTEMKVGFTELKNCMGSTSSSETIFVRTESPIQGDLFINELLFNPYEGGVDFIELINVSDKWINMKDIQLANYAKGKVSNVKKGLISHVLKPNDILVLTSSPNDVFSFYPYSDSLRVYTMQLPSMNIDSGSVLVLNSYGKQVDKVSYSEKWHFALIDDVKGKSLEKINPTYFSNSMDNWHTASENYHFATPGLLNSQQLNSTNTTKTYLVNPKISPNNDGFEDILELHYVFEGYENQLNAVIYDAYGNTIVNVADNLFVSQSGNISWDGIDSKGNIPQTGVYILHIQSTSFDTGDIKQLKFPFVLVAPN